MADCLFCGIVAGDIPAEVVAETDRTIAFRDIQPQAPGPRARRPAPAHRERRGRHYRRMPTTSSRWSRRPGRSPRPRASAAADRGYRLVINVGPDALNSVPHLHLHVLGGQQMAGLVG